MEETLINRLQKMIDNIKTLSDSALELNSMSVFNDHDLKTAEVTCHKLEIFLDRFNTELNNYFRLSNNPSADDVSRFTSIQLEAEEAQIELSMKLKLEKPGPSGTAVISSKLPKLNLPIFDGDILRWQEFWDQYKSNIHDRNLPDVEKLLYLKSSLQGSAKRTIEGLESTSKNYQIAINTLRERYGKDSQIIDAHYSALSKIQPADKANSSCRRVLNEVERHLRVLSSLGEDVGHSHLRFLILEKFPEELVYELKTKITSTSIQEIRSELEKIISAREEASRLVQERNTNKTNDYTIETLHTSNWNNKMVPQQAQVVRKTPYNLSHRPQYNHERDRFNKGYKNLKAVRKFNYKSPDKTSRPDQRRGGLGKRKLDNLEEDRNQRKRKLSKYTCIFCGEAHYNDQCLKYKSIKERKDKLKDLCYCCLRQGHQVKNCTSTKSCSHCAGQHNRALCPKKFPFKINASINMHVNTNSRTMLQTAIVEAKKEADDSRHVRCRVLLDSGSQRSYITEKLAKNLKLDTEERSSLSVYAFGADTPREYDSSLVKIHLKSTCMNDIERMIDAYVVPVISHHVPYPYKEVRELDHDVHMADDGSLGSEIDILIGNDYYFSIISTNKIKIKDNLYLVDSELGWILSGQWTFECEEPELSVTTYFQANSSVSKLNEPDLPLDKYNLKMLWDLESIGITDSPKLNREEEALRNFNETTQFLDGRHSIRWPWREYPPNLPSNFGVAFGRLVNLVKRSETKLLKSYEETLKYQMDNGIIELIPDHEHTTDRPVHYLPHHGVLYPGKPMRIVYDASAKMKDSKSLNECLYCGPSLVEDLTSLLIRFRSHQIGLSADVEKAFLQISIQSEDRDVTRFLWIKDITKPVTQDNLLHMRFCRVPFGIISSPFLLNATIKHHLSKGSKKLKNIIDDIYVDNLVTGTDNIKEALELHKDSRQAFQEISMNLRSWSSNSKEFMKQVSDTCENDVVKTLGLDWYLNDDTIKLRLKDLKEAKTKREVLRNISQVYDPCGFAAPSLLPAKLFLQDLWKEKSIKWDTVLSQELYLKWEEINSNLDDIKEISLTRHFTKSLHDEDNQLHCFVDSSTKAYAAVVYIVNSKGKAFVMGKSRLVPIKDREDLKIPRLELLGSVIGNRLIQYVEKSLRLKITKQFLWSDSQIVIDWISSEKLLPPFIARRVNEIKANKNLIIRYVPTELNPADIGTRTGKTISEKYYWLHGPNFLLQKPNTWPSSRLKEISLLSGEGLWNTENISNKANNTKDKDKGKQVLKDGTKEKESPKSQTRSHENPSKIQEIKSLQKQFFPDEINGKVTHLTRNLALFMDVDGLLRCKGRFMNANWSYDMRYPILLPKECEFTYEMIKEVHEENYHVGVNHTLSIIRESYWIPQGKSQVLKVLRRCPSCIKHGGGPFKLPATPALPPERINYSHPFTFTGVDYLGPVLVKTETGSRKRWICLFTCLAVRAVHLEVVQDLTANETLLALRRFISTRGIPSLITSDNATNFKLTSEVLTQPYCLDKGIKWRFIPQLAPWFGGFYERLIGIVKTCLKRTLQKNLLSECQLLTVIKEVEAVLNSRPLTCVDAEQDYILKPSDFLAMKKCITLEADPEALISQGTLTKADLIQSWKRGLTILEEFKSMFFNRYLPSLRERYRHSPKEPRVTSKLTPEIGQVVQIKGATSNRENWKVGKIIELSQGKDGACRTAKVKVGNTEFTRSIAQLYPLEVEELESDTNAESKANHDIPVINTDQNIDNDTSINDNIENDDETNKSGYVDMPQLDDDNTSEIITASRRVIDLRKTLEDQDVVDTVTEPNESLNPENSNEAQIKPQRAAATRALEKIREWTQSLVNLL